MTRSAGMPGSSFPSLLETSGKVDGSSRMDFDNAQLNHVAARFFPASGEAHIREYGNGNINKTFLVSPGGPPAAPFLLQRLNTSIFRHPDLVMRNIRSVTEHVRSGTGSRNMPKDRRWEVPDVLLTGDGADHWCSKDGSFWRALRFIGESRTFDAVSDVSQAREVGFALGTFHRLVSGLSPEKLADTLPGFHVAPRYLEKYDSVMTSGPRAKSSEEEFCTRFIEDHRSWIPVLEQALDAGFLRLRPIHGDPKVNNILFDESTGNAIGMIDLDTVKPGLVQYDIGDCLRSACNPAGEETPEWRSVRFQPATGRAVLEGYLSVAREFFDEGDFDYLPDAIRLIAFELGLRFFTDHLEGDVYFKVSRPGQNLSRALVQFRLAESIDGQFQDLKAIVRALR